MNKRARGLDLNEDKVLPGEHNDPSCIQEIGAGSDRLEKQTTEGRKKLLGSERHNPSENP